MTGRALTPAQWLRPTSGPYSQIMSARTLELQMSPQAAWATLRSAASAIGKVEQANETPRYLVLKARYGLNPVRLRVSVLSGLTEDTSVLDIQARGQDIWGSASRKIIDRLCAAL